MDFMFCFAEEFYKQLIEVLPSEFKAENITVDNRHKTYSSKVPTIEMKCSDDFPIGDFSFGNEYLEFTRHSADDDDDDDLGFKWYYNDPEFSVGAIIDFVVERYL